MVKMSDGQLCTVTACPIAVPPLPGHLVVITLWRKQEREEHYIWNETAIYVILMRFVFAVWFSSFSIQQMID